MQEKELVRIEKIRPSGSLFGINRQSLVIPNSDPRKDLSIRSSHPGRFLYSLSLSYLNKMTLLIQKHVPYLLHFSPSSLFKCILVHILLYTVEIRNVYTLNIHLSRLQIMSWKS